MQSDEDMAAALHALCLRIDGEDLHESFFAELRSSGIVEALPDLMAQGTATHLTAMFLIASLTTDACDPNGAHKTRRRLYACGGFDLILSEHLFSDGALTAALAVATVQNMLADARLTMSICASREVTTRLQALTLCDNSAVVQAATACLHNLAVSAPWLCHGLCPSPPPSPPPCEPEPIESDAAQTVPHAIVKLQRRVITRMRKGGLASSPTSCDQHSPRSRQIRSPPSLLWS